MQEIVITWLNHGNYDAGDTMITWLNHGNYNAGDSDYMAESWQL